MGGSPTFEPGRSRPRRLCQLGRIGRGVAEHQAMSRLERITVDPGICHGTPTVRGMRIPVQRILEPLASGMAFDELLADYPYLEREDLLAALEYGAAASVGQLVVISSS